ncbi:MAG: class I SAM-dependent methyltransferase [Magnetococcales bacterium]|nr:class I SAM-dependent methyltransferase [Magnetococcales bacterium]
MNPNERSAQRFFSALVDVCPAPLINHVYLCNQSVNNNQFLIHSMVDNGFKGTLVAARASIAKSSRDLNRDLSVVLSDHPSNSEKAEHILLELNQGREAARMTIEAALEAISDSGQVWIFGNQESGIVSIAKRFSSCKTALYKGHLRLISLTKNSKYQEKTGKKRNKKHTPTLDDEGFCQIDYKGLPIISRPGVFSWQEPDPASILLLDAMEKLDIDPGPTVLDWGCGSGLLSAALAQRWPSCHFTLSDDQFSAVRCAKKTMGINRLEQRSLVVAEDGIGPTLEEKKFSTIISNPPFHRGVRTDFQAAELFIKNATAILAKNGSIWLVGNRFLNYEKQLAKVLKHVEVVANNSTFSVIRGWQ